MDLNGESSTVDEVVGCAVMIGFDLWLIVLFLEVEERDGLEAEARGLGRAE